jgi:hypothetical protein
LSSWCFDVVLETAKIVEADAIALLWRAGSYETAMRVPGVLYFSNAVGSCSSGRDVDRWWGDRIAVALSQFTNTQSVAFLSGRSS